MIFLDRFVTALDQKKKELSEFILTKAGSSGAGDKKKICQTQSATTQPKIQKYVYFRSYNIPFFD